MIGIPKSKVAWNNENLQKLMDMWDEGISASLIAQEIPNATRNSILGKAHRLGLKNRKDSIPTAKPNPPKVKMARIVVKKDINLQSAPTVAPLIPFMEYGVTTCRSIQGYDKQNQALFCPNPKSESESFCPYHISIYYNPGANRERR